MQDWTVDTTLNVEGVATAVAAAGAALAYVIDLVSRRLRDFRQQRRGRRGRLIIDLAQQRYEAGVSEEEIQEVLVSQDESSARLRHRFRVRRHKKSEKFELELEEHLVQLVYDRLLEVDAQDHYRLYGSHWFVEERKRDEAERRRSESNAAGDAAELAITRAAMHDRLVQTLWHQIEQPPTQYYSPYGDLRALVDLGVPLTPERLETLIEAIGDEHRPQYVRDIAALLRQDR